MHDDDPDLSEVGQKALEKLDPSGGLGVALLRAGRRYLGIKTAQENLDDGIRTEFAADVEKMIAGWRAWESAWRDVPEDQRPTAVDIRAIVDEARRVYSTTSDPRKRVLLHNAVVNAFDPKQYALGMTRRLLRILDELEYGDVVVLRRLVEFNSGTTLDVAAAGCWPATDDHHHLSVLVGEGLVLAFPPSHGRISPTRSTGGGTSALLDNDKIRVSALGVRLVNLLREPAPPEGVSAQ